MSIQYVVNQISTTVGSIFDEKIFPSIIFAPTAKRNNNEIAFYEIEKSVLNFFVQRDLRSFRKDLVKILEKSKTRSSHAVFPNSRSKF